MSNVVSELMQLAQLRREGLLTEEEFRLAKAKLLSAADGKHSSAAESYPTLESRSAMWGPMQVGWHRESEHALSKMPAAPLFTNDATEGEEADIGTIVFGDVVDEDNDLHIGKTRTLFSPTETIAWVATFPAPVAAPCITLAVYRGDGEEMQCIWMEDISVEDPQFDMFSDELAPDVRANLGLDRLGHYLVEYRRGDTVLAEGAFEILSEEAMRAAREQAATRPGSIQFGSTYRLTRDDDPVIDNPRNTFALDESVAWIAT